VPEDSREPLTFEEAIIVADAELIARAALDAGFPMELARIAAENSVRYPFMVTQLREVLRLDDLGISRAMMGPEAFLEGLRDLGSLDGPRSPS
jgi:hypothetical protein